jgi:proton-dependent oligopeptide transporter, POT family
MNRSTPAATGARNDRFGHPQGLGTLFFTELWERFSHYGMRALLVLFMVDQIERGGLGFTDPTATAVYGLFTAALYLTALPGGWMADRLIGQQRAIWFGGILIMCGQFALAIPGLASFFLGLMLLVLGTGLLKPAISAIVGELYAPDDPRRDSGFTIFYMGINIGAALGPLICGFFAQQNWHYGFAAAGSGMLVGLLHFHLQRPALGEAGIAPAESFRAPGAAHAAWSVILLGLAVIGIVLIAGLNGWITPDAERLARISAVLIAAITALYFGAVLVAGGLDRVERNRVIVIIVLVAAAAMFWAGFEQAGSSLNLFAERYTLREFGDFKIPAPWFQSLNPMFIIVLAPLYSVLWIGLARRYLEPSTPAKFALGLILLGLGFAVMIAAASLVSQGSQVLPTWLITTYLLHTMGELALSPVGLSAISKLSPRRYVGQMMGMWFIAASLGSIVAGLIAGQFRDDALEDMPGLYLQIVLTTVGTGVLVAAFARPLKRLMGGVR